MCLLGNLKVCLTLFCVASHNKDDNDSYHGDKGEDLPGRSKGSEEDQRLKNAATIGTALMVVNSERALILL